MTPAPSQTMEALQVLTNAMHEAEALSARLADETAARRAAERARDDALADLAHFQRERAADTTRTQLERALQECASLRQRLSAIGSIVGAASPPVAPPVPCHASMDPLMRGLELPPPHPSQAPTPSYYGAMPSRMPLISPASYTHPSSPRSGSILPSVPSRANTISPPTSPPESGIRSTVVNLGVRRARSPSTEGEPPAKRQHSSTVQQVIRLPSVGFEVDVNIAQETDRTELDRSASAPQRGALSAPHSRLSSPLPSMPSSPEEQPAASPAPEVPVPAPDFKPQVITTPSATILLNAEGKRICGECGTPGREIDGKCVEKWGPGPKGRGTVCSKCRKKMRAYEKRTKIGSINPTVAKLSPLSDDELLELGSRPVSRARQSLKESGSRGNAGRLASSTARTKAAARLSLSRGRSPDEGTARIATLRHDVDGQEDELMEEEDGGEDELVDNDEFMAAVDAAEAGVGPEDAFSP
ncbi:hypothetical protein BD626DRAFT_573726 [Schizophyllum amplum]|uniref:Uncharacterized protein n=1 Tax=Schizophyllum amplum TaxID=97359 RepID=A0A550C0H0_9AGAR|nr:hypothetical protein BD626DRAFT_573726 [Auriculariopsis ampla]